jgi:transcriptional regulator with XRE-family HTH domain
MSQARNRCPVFGARLAAVLGRRGLKRSDLVTLCGVSPTAVTNWLNGQIPRPTVMLLFAREWGPPTVDYLLGDTSVMPEPNPKPVRTEEG